ncbi:hypothetical protein Tco_0425200, partial [Tanacetum coccineum]
MKTLVVDWINVVIGGMRSEFCSELTVVSGDHAWQQSEILVVCPRTIRSHDWARILIGVSKIHMTTTILGFKLMILRVPQVYPRCPARMFTPTGPTGQTHWGDLMANNPMPAHSADALLK